MADIDVGATASDRGENFLYGYTIIVLDNPANATGKINHIEIFAHLDMTGVVVGSFYLVSGVTYKCRGSASIPNVTGGSKTTLTAPTDFTAFDIEVGDYIGCYFTFGNMERDAAGYAGLYYASGKHIDPDDSTTYTLSEGHTISLYGEGAAVAAYERSAAIAVGTVVSAVRGAWGRTRTSSTIVGIVATTKRLYLSFVRTASVLVGILVTAVAIEAVQRAIVYIGVYVRARRNITKTFASSVIVGVVVTVTRLVAYIVTATTTVGVVATTVIRQWGRVRTATVLVGAKVTATRKIAAARASSVLLGISTTATRKLAAIRKATVKVGVVVSALIRIVGRVLKIVVITSQYRQINPITAMYRKIRSFTIGGH